MAADQRLTIEDLKANVPEFAWDYVLQSGNEVPPSAETSLENLWQDHLASLASDSPDEDEPTFYTEGGVIQVAMNRYERDPAARQACLDHYGTDCGVCRVDWTSVYGAEGHTIMHVHHRTPLSARGGNEHQVDPIKDLLPVCPNCHAMLHKMIPPTSVEVMRRRIARKRRDQP